MHAGGAALAALRAQGLFWGFDYNLSNCNFRKRP